MTGLLAFGPYKVKTKILFGPKQELYLKKKQKQNKTKTQSHLVKCHTSCSTYKQKKLKLPNSSVQCHSHSATVTQQKNPRVSFWKLTQISTMSLPVEDNFGCNHHNHP